jgi:hypothetical protein
MRYLFIMLIMSFNVNAQKVIVENIPKELVLQSSDAKEKKYIYQASSGVSLAISGGQKLNSFEDVKIISITSLLAIKNSSKSFELLHEDDSLVVNGNNYVFFIYSLVDNKQLYYVYSYHTYIHGKMINLLFYVPENQLDEWIEKIGDTISFIEYKIIPSSTSE